MTIADAYSNILEDGIRLGAGDFVDLDALKVAADVLGQIVRGELVPIVHGRWKKTIECGCTMHQCSVCGARVVKGIYEYENPNLYCYRCGARMDGDGDV